MFVSLPTGSGKSLCYSCLSWVFDQQRNTSGSIILVVSPLVALMKDQVAAFQNKGMNAVFVSGRETIDVITEDVEELIH